MTTVSLFRLVLPGSKSPLTSSFFFDNTDYIGGHIKGSRNVPSRQLDAMMPTLVRQLKDKKTVVFHCSLSQQRGPSAALKYLREKESLSASQSQPDTEKKQSLGDAESKNEDKPETAVQQQVYVLDRGFVGWQEVYGEDEQLTEGYRKDLWKDGYWG